MEGPMLAGGSLLFRRLHVSFSVLTAFGVDDHGHLQQEVYAREREHGRVGRVG